MIGGNLRAFRLLWELLLLCSLSAKHGVGAFVCSERELSDGDNIFAGHGRYTKCQ